MAESQHSQEYYSFAEVMQILGKKKSTLYTEIDEGKIPFELPPNKKIGMRFPKEGIDILAKRARKEQIEKRTMHIRFEVSTTADLWTAVNNARRIYGSEDIISFERALEWRDINSDISMSVKEEKLFVGMATFIPLDEEVIQALLKDSIREKDIADQAIRRWTEEQLSVYVAGIAIVSSGNKLTDNIRGQFLLKHAIKWGITLTAQYDIKNWYGIGVTPEGQAILEVLGFRQLTSLEDGKRKGYILDVSYLKPTRLVQRYLGAIEKD